LRRELLGRRAKRTTANRSRAEAINAEGKVRVAAARRWKRNLVVCPETLVVIIGRAGVR